MEGMSRGMYRTCVLGGSTAGIITSAFFAARAGLTPLLWIAIAGLVVAIALFIAAITKVLTGRESFTFLHYQLVSIATAAAVIYAFDGPIISALNLLAVALAVTQAIGRLGCASAGCCHGRPFSFGVRYDREHVAEHWAGVPLLPVQLTESAALFILASVCAIRLEHAFVIYMLSYAFLRFFLELLRGDARRHILGVSEAQWICVVIAIVAGFWQRGAALAVPTLIVGATMAIVRAKRIDPDALARAIAATRGDGMLQSARGIRISYGTTAAVEHYTVSSSDDHMTFARARAIAAFLRGLTHREQPLRVMAGNSGTWHLIVSGVSR
jgi:prolipoprotein diacylglyceryltransferase